MSGFPPPLTYNPVTFALPGNLPASQTGPARYVMAGAGTVYELHASLGTGPVGFHGNGQAVASVSQNGNTIGTMTIDENSDPNNADLVLSPPVTLAAGDYLTANVVSRRFTSQAPADLLVQVFKVGI